MQAPVEVGDVIAGKYEIERHLAAGGMGIVVVARHVQLDRQVAIKFMLPELREIAVDPDALERFLREGRAASKLRGENVARVLDVDTLDEAGQVPYMVMEYLHGVDLGRHIKDHGPLPLSEAVDHLLQACVAMAEAHQLGIVHRDLKPSNLFLTRRPDGVPLVKVLDFGISKLFSDIGDGSQTGTAMLMGSPSYMPPEQARAARNADVRSDIWSLGVILYEAAAKKLPFTGSESTAALLAKLIYEAPVPLRQAAPSLPAAFCTVVDRCLQRDPDARYQSVGELASALLPFAGAHGRSAAHSVHAIIGGSSAAAAQPAPAAPPAATSADASAASPAAELALHDTALGHADTYPTGAQSSASDDAGALRGDTPARADTAGAEAAGADAAGAEPLLELDPEAVASLRGDQAATAGKDAKADAKAGKRDQNSADKRSKRPAVAPMVAGDGRNLVVEAAAAQLRRPRGRGVRSIATLALFAVLGVLTCVIALGDGIAALDAIDRSMFAAAHDLASELLRKLPKWMLIAASLVLLMPAIALIILRALGLRVLAASAAWWLGQSTVYVSRQLARAVGEESSWLPDAPAYWLELIDEAALRNSVNNAAQVLFGVGTALMIGALLYLLRQGSRRRRW
ncbi:serine/threonine-protein kinase [Haliangium ochraceum]|uniref:Serine/threonine protein kinase n=1 Tax=Haliangium ochraceum (strain DSM 14365 / JCM 11303 / SMP-2) TaxID=502025 RepID=D0LLG2_HALO1|nr:serine/threonine-protein kinase [Haliangium ochraceum]ACY13179.1 serine/threonine protein kinase [Haliangium ochraceum DSM 14365]